MNFDKLTELQLLEALEEEPETSQAELAISAGISTAAGVGPEVEDITTPVTFCTTVDAITRKGAMPDLVDCDLELQLVYRSENENP